VYFDENKLDQIITPSKNSIASGNDAHELALQKNRMLVAFVGIDPRTEESGQMKKGWFINRKGNRYLRKTVYIAATVAIQKNEYFKNYYMKLRTRGKSHTVAVLAVAGKLLRIIYSLVKSRKKYDPDYHYKLQNQEMRVYSNYTAKKIKKRNSNLNKQQPLLST
jgi:hypothetical protein